MALSRSMRNSRRLTSSQDRDDEWLARWSPSFCWISFRNYLHILAANYILHITGLARSHILIWNSSPIRNRTRDISHSTGSNNFGLNRINAKIGYCTMLVSVNCICFKLLVTLVIFERNRRSQYSDDERKNHMKQAEEPGFLYFQEICSTALRDCSKGRLEN